MLSNAEVKGLVKVEEEPVANHYHEGRIFNSVTVSSQRSDANSKVDYLRLYFEKDAFDPEIFKVGNYIKYTGELVKSKITEKLSDVAVSLDTVRVATEEELKENKEVNTYLGTGSVLDMVGRIIKINPETVSKEISSISILVMADNAEGRRVIAKLTGVGRMAEILKTMEVGATVAVFAKIFSYPVTHNPELASHYLHDSRIASIKRITDAG